MAKKGLLHHIEIYVPDLTRALKFWDWFLLELGYQVFQAWEEGRSYILDETYLVFVQVQKKYLSYQYHRCGTGLNHLAFYADSKEHVDEVTEKLQQRNIKILYKDKHPYAGGEGHYAVYFEDPNRMKVELVAP